jgi:hydrogenase expression/formation protein HypD
MKFIDEVRNKEIAQGLIQKIHAVSTRPIQLMEVCGTHTVSFFRYGIRGMLPPYVRLISGPGCPVCVTPNRDIDLAIALSRQKGVIIAIFGDMMSPGSLQACRRKPEEISNHPLPLKPCGLQEEPGERVVFFAIGFETTSPTIAVALLQSKRQNIRNLYFLNSQKGSLQPRTLCNEKVSIDGYPAGAYEPIIGAGLPVHLNNSTFLL